MEYSDLGKIFLNILAPSLVFIFLVFFIVYLLARFVGAVCRSDQIAILAAFAILGGILGVSVGASRSPELGAILPALLTAITFLLGYMFGKEHLLEWRPVIPYCIIALLITSFYGLFLGAEYRGKHEDFERKYRKHMLYFEKVELEVLKEKKLKELMKKESSGHSDSQTKPDG